MKRIFSFAPKKLLAVALAVGITLGVSSAAGAWWPERPTFTIESPAPYVTFNSITNNPNYGDERTFFDTKPMTNTSLGGFVDNQKVADGQEYLVRIYVHNNAADNLNGANLDGAGVAKDSKVRIHLPTATETALRANAYVSASNAKPVEVADTVDFYGDSKFSMSYVPGSAIMYTNVVPKGFALSDSIVTDGASVGYTGANGVIPGCFQYSGIVTIKVKVKMETPDFTVEKKVTIPGSGSWNENVTVTPGQAVTYQITFTNKGNTTLKDVVIRDQLPTGMKIVPGTTKIYNANHPSGVDAGTDAVVNNGGIVIGTYNAGTNGFVQFKATAPAVADLKCGTNTLTNVAEARVNGMATTNTADITLKKECVEPPKPVYSCDALNVESFDGRKIKATVSYTAKNGAAFKDVVYNFGDSTNNLVTNNTTVEHTYANDGTYTVAATVNFTVDGKTVPSTSDACKKVVTFKGETPVTPPTTTPEVPETLPNTGTESVLGLFMGVSILGAVGHRLWTMYRS